MSEDIIPKQPEQRTIDLTKGSKLFIALQEALGRAERTVQQFVEAQTPPRGSERKAILLSFHPSDVKEMQGENP